MAAVPRMALLELLRKAAADPDVAFLRVSGERAVLGFDVGPREAGRTAFAQPDGRSARAQGQRGAGSFRAQGLRLAAVRDAAEADVRAYRAFPRSTGARSGAGRHPNRPVAEPPPLKVLFSFRSGWYDQTLQGIAGTPDRKAQVAPLHALHTRVVRQLASTRQGDGQAAGAAPRELLDVRRDGAIRRHPGGPGELLAKQGRGADAIAAFRQALDLDPEHRGAAEA